MDNNVTYVSLTDIENRARALRAEAARDMAKGFGAWFRGLFSNHGTSHKHA